MDSAEADYGGNEPCSTADVLQSPDRIALLRICRLQRLRMQRRSLSASNKSGSMPVRGATALVFCVSNSRLSLWKNQGRRGHAVLDPQREDRVQIAPPGKRVHDL